MKQKSFLVLLLSLVMMSSCNNVNDDNIGPHCEISTKSYLSKITTTYYEPSKDPQTVTDILSYDEKNQVTQIETNGRKTYLYYDNGGKIIKSIGEKNDETLDNYSVYNYDGENLTSIKSTNTNNVSTFIYDAKGRVIQSNFCENGYCSDSHTRFYSYDDNNNVTVQINGTLSSYRPGKSNYYYDDKLSPFTNMNKYLRIAMGGAYAMSKNNYIIDKTSIRNNKEGNWVPSQTTTYTIQYDRANYPTKVVGKNANGEIVVEYLYEYIIIRN